jgi:hypothetical protein
LTTTGIVCRADPGDAAALDLVVKTTWSVVRMWEREQSGRTGRCLLAATQAGEMTMATSTRLCAAALVAALSIGPALAQTTTAPTTTAPSSTRIDERNDGFNWGLLGLLGLAGLAPLFMRKDHHGNVHADTRR